MRKNISVFCGIFKLKPGEKSIVQELIEERRAEKQKEDREFIHSLRGKYQMMPGDKPFAEWMADLNREEKELEERKSQRHAALGKNSSLARLRGKLNRIKRTGFTKRSR